MSTMYIYPFNSNGPPVGNQLISTDVSGINFYNPTNFMVADGAIDAHKIEIKTAVYASGSQEPIYGNSYVLKGDFKLSNSTPVAPNATNAFVNFIVIGGTVTEIDQNRIDVSDLNKPNFTSSTDVKQIYSITNFSLKAADLFLSFLTPSTADDAAQWLSIFAGDDVVNGGNGKEWIVTYGGNDVIYPGPGDNFIDGGAGTNIVGYQDVRSSVNIVPNVDGSIILSSNFIGTQTIKNIQFIKFSDSVVNVSDLFSAVPLAPVQNPEGDQIYRLYNASFGRHPDKAGFAYWEAQYFVNHLSLNEIASDFIGSPEFASLYGANPSTSAFVNALYQNVLHRTADDSGAKFWTLGLESGQIMRSEALVSFSTSPENIALTAPYINNGYVFI